MVGPHPSGLRDCETRPSFSCPPRPRPGPVIVLDLTPLEIALSPCRAHQDLQHPTKFFQGAERNGFICVTVALPAAQYQGRNTAPVEHEGEMRAGGSETRNDTQHGAKQCPDQSGRSPTVRKGLAIGTERPPNSCRRRRPHMMRTLHTQDSGGVAIGRPHSTPTGVQSLRGLIPAAFCRPQFDARVPSGPNRFAVCRHVPSSREGQRGERGGRSVPPHCARLPLSVPDGRRGHAGQGIGPWGAVGLGETDEFGLGVEVQKGGAGTRGDGAWEPTRVQVHHDARA